MDNRNDNINALLHNSLGRAEAAARILSVSGDADVRRKANAVLRLLNLAGIWTYSMFIE